MKLQGVENCGGLSHEGIDFAADAAGCIDIPDDNKAAIEASFSHGFVQCVDSVKARKKSASAEAPGVE